MNQSLAQQAVNFALFGKWKNARDTNLEILKNNPNDIDALNRLAKSYLELGNIVSARSTIKKVLKIDPYNPIAVKCLEKWKNLTRIDKKTSKQLPQELFLEEPGKTKIIHLIHTCDKPVLAKLDCGDMVYENVRSHRISIMTDSNTYIGKLPDDVSIRLKKFIKLGYKYQFAIKSIDKNEVKIFAREIYRPDKYMNVSSFSSEKIDYIPYTPPELIHEKPDVSTLEEESESPQSTEASTFSEHEEN